MLSVLQALVSALHNHKASKKRQNKTKISKKNVKKINICKSIIGPEKSSSRKSNYLKKGRQYRDTSVCLMRDCRDSTNMLAHCENNNSVLTHCDNNNGSKKCKKENRPVRKETQSSCTCCGSLLKDGKVKPLISSNPKPETTVLDTSPTEHSVHVETTTVSKHAPLNRISSYPQSETSTTSSSSSYPPPVLKYPSTSTRDNKLTRSGSDTTCCRPPPNRTILKSDGGIIISESEERYVINDEAGSCRPVDEQTVNKLVRDRHSAKSKSLPRSEKGARPSRNPKSKRYDNQPFLSVNVPSPPRYHRDPPPEYSEPPNYYTVV